MLSEKCTYPAEHGSLGRFRVDVRVAVMRWGYI